MATTPNPIPELQPNHWLITWGHFVKAHEKLLIIVLGSLLLFRFGQGIENIILKHDAKKADAAAITVKQDEVSNKDLQDQLKEMRARADVQTAQLKADIQSQIAALEAQRKKDAASTPAEIAARWQALLTLKPGSVTQLNTTQTAITNDAANQTVQALEEIPVLRIQVTDLAVELSTERGITTQQDKTITGLKTQIVDEKASHVADVKLEKDKAKHQFWKGLKIGIVIGAVGVEAVRIWAGKP